MGEVNASEIINTLSIEQVEYIIENYRHVPGYERLLVVLRHFLNEVE